MALCKQSNLILPKCTLCGSWSSTATFCSKSYHITQRLNFHWFSFLMNQRSKVVRFNVRRLKLQLSLVIISPYQWRIQDFPRVGRQPSGGGARIRIYYIFSKIVARGARAWDPPPPSWTPLRLWRLELRDSGSFRRSGISLRSGPTGGPLLVIICISSI